MDGITILNTFAGNDYLVFTLLLCALGIVLLIVCIMFIVVSKQDNDDKPSFFIVLTCTALGIFFLRCSYNTIKLSASPKYQITVDDSVSFNDFMERYEIIKQDGKIYTVIEKEK